MDQVKRLISSRLIPQRSWKRRLWDVLLGLAGSLTVTMLIYALRLYPRIPNISLLYLVVVLALASTRGLFPAVIASLMAFLSFDFLLVRPLYTLTVAQPAEWLALLIFLCTAIITGQLASALRRRAKEAREREQETRTLYELLRETNNEEELDNQLGMVAQTLVEAFASRGVRDCLILLPDDDGKPILHVSAHPSRPLPSLTTDELTTAVWVMRKGEVVDFYARMPLSRHDGTHASHMVIRSTAMPQSSRVYLSLFPLKNGHKVIGVLALVLEEDPRRFSREKRLGSEADRSDPRSPFFWALLDQATSMIERARLHRESLQIEVLRRTDALRAALLSSVSHDLRTPLTSIKAAASSLLQEDVSWSEEERRSFAQAIERQADRLNRLVENLLDLSRIEGGALQPEKEWYPIEELIHDVLGRMQPLLQERTVTTRLPADLPPVELDYLMIDQVFTNLIENALRYTPTGSPLEIGASASATDLVCWVADRGPGIPPGDLERIFDKFYRVGRTRETGGTGVGLSVCRGLILAHQGQIWAENRPGGGAMFRFTLPLGHASCSGASELKEGEKDAPSTHASP